MMTQAAASPTTHAKLAVSASRSPPSPPSASSWKCAPPDPDRPRPSHVAEEADVGGCALNEGEPSAKEADAERRGSAQL